MKFQDILYQDVYKRQFSIWAVADIFNRQALSLNTLAATAWVMLLCNPVWLFDVGFQLSFLAVASILPVSYTHLSGTYGSEVFSLAQIVKRKINSVVDVTEFIYVIEAQLNR